MIRTPPWIWPDNAAEATLLIAFVLHSPEVTGHVPNLYNKTGGGGSVSESQGPRETLQKGVASHHF